MVWNVFTNNPVACKWVYTAKHQPDGFIERLKARRGAKGETQFHGVNYFSTFYSVAEDNFFRIIIQLLPIWTRSGNGFLHGDNLEELYG